MIVLAWFKDFWSEQQDCEWDHCALDQALIASHESVFALSESFIALVAMC